MSDDKAKGAATIEIDSAAGSAAPARKEQPTREELKEKGWSAKELDAGEKRGMVAKPEEKKKEEPAAEKPKDEQAGKKPADEKKDGNFLDAMDREMTPEQEKVFLETFPPGTKPRAFYFRAKNERHARQRAEADRDRMALELQTHKDELARARSGAPEPELDAEGNEIDPDDKPLTMKQLKAAQKEQLEANEKSRNELRARGEKAEEALESQEEYAKSTLPDFESTVKLATDLVQNIDKIADPIKKAKARKLVRDLQLASAHADKYGVDDYTAPFIAYELGQLHERYGKDSEQNGDKEEADPKANGGLTPEQMKRIEENTQRKVSSASLPGSDGGKRTIAVADVTIKDLLAMSPEKRYKFRKDHPERYADLQRG